MALFRSRIRAASGTRRGERIADLMDAHVRHAVTITDGDIANSHGRSNMLATWCGGAFDPATGGERRRDAADATRRRARTRGG
jgi:hypothetical protein